MESTEHLIGPVFVETQDLAAHFGKPHKTVLAVTDRLTSNFRKGQAGLLGHFAVGTYPNRRNRYYRHYKMTHEGFVLVALALDGDRITEFRERLVSVFTRMGSEGGGGIRQVVDEIFPGGIGGHTKGVASARGSKVKREGGE